MPSSEWYSFSCYRHAVEVLESTEKLTADEALEVLLARAALYKDIQRTSFISIDRANRIRNLDEKLKDWTVSTKPSSAQPA